MKNNNKAFTLIELLAVIIILAIIALIAVPTIMNIITKARKSAFKDSAYGVIKAGELYYTEKLLDPNGMESDVTFEFPDSAEELPLKGQKPDGGQIKITRNGNVAIALLYGNNCIRKGLTETEVTVEEDATVENCTLGEEVAQGYVDTTLNGADPVVKTGMIPVSIAPNGTVTKADTNTEWYNYSNKEWANVVTVTESSRANYMSAPAGTQIQETDILTYLVWIPRYKYELWNVDTTTPSKATPHSIAITFENKDTTKSNGSTNGTYLTHPAFTFGEEELNGIWVGKFETSIDFDKEEELSNNFEIEPTFEETIALMSLFCLIKPNVMPMGNLNVSMAFNIVKGMNGANNAFGLDTTSDTHMMKNTEWGAVAYLSHSVYGKNGEVYINNASKYTTGCGANNTSDSNTSSCLNAYGSKSDNVYNQSTTGNISGVFDMSGGKHEYVMGYDGNYGLSGFASDYVIEDKYVDTYSSTSETQYTKRKLGDATGEMGPFSNYRGSWYQDYAYFANGLGSWFVRGSVVGVPYFNNDVAGMFNFIITEGVDDNSIGFRVTIA